MDEGNVLTVVAASQTRRWLGVSILFAIGFMTLFVAFSSPPELVWQVFLIVVGLGAFWLGERMRRATERRLELTDEGLFDDRGAVLARMDDIVKVERGVFAFKPSNGFLIHLKTKGPGSWQPGLWWRAGRKIGVGGVAAAHQTKLMADIIAAKLLERDGA